MGGGANLHFQKLQEQIKISPFGGPNIVGNKPFFENMQNMPNMPPIDSGNGGKVARPGTGYPGQNAPLASTDFVHQTPGLPGYPPSAQRAVSYAPPTRFSGHHTSNRKMSGYKSSGAARFNCDDDTPTRPGSGYRDSGNSQALVPRNTNEEDCVLAEWSERLTKMWNSVEAYCRAYVVGENKSLHLYLQTNTPNVWQYICDVLYPNNPTTAGSSHAQVLLADVPARAHLVERLVIQYFINQMWCAEGWSQFNADTDERMRQAEHRLKNLDRTFSRTPMQIPSEAANHPPEYHVAERQAALETQAQLVARILMDSRFQEFRQFKINHHVDRVKMIVGPMLPTTKTRNESQYDLHNLVSQAMELSAVMFESRRRFDFTWNSTCTKFSAEHHSSLDSSLPPIQLQVNQWRLKLVVTPGITLRDERNPNISRRVLKSDVLVMS